MKRIAFVWYALLSVNGFCAEGSLRVVGDAGAAQSATQIAIRQCRADATTLFKRKSCVPVPGQFRVNDPLSLPEGFYAVLFQNSWTTVDIVAGQEATLRLRKLSIPKAGNAIRYRVYYDLTDTAEQNRFLSANWGAGGTSADDYENEACSGPVEYQAICRALNVSPQALLGVVFRFSPRGSFFQATLASDWVANHGHSHQVFWVEWPEMGGISVMSDTAPLEQNTVSVFPGTYLLAYYDQVAPPPASGKLVYGVAVK